MKTLLSIFCLLFAFSASAQKTTTDTLSLRFRQSHSEIDPLFGNNKAELDSMASGLADNAAAITAVEITGAASPEGPTAFNETLSRLRADRLMQYLDSKSLLPSAATSTFVGRDWKGLLDEVKADTMVPQRDQVLTLLQDIVNAIDKGIPDSEANLRNLKAIANGVPYGYMYRKMFPSLRTSTLAISYLPYHIDIPDTLTNITSLPPTLPIPEILPFPVSTMSVCRPFYMDIKTNMLYDALLLPNIGVDFYVGKNLSVGANWMYGWWDKDSVHRYWRAYGGDINLRWWFGHAAHEKPLTGHHLGVFAGVVTYDFEFGGRGWMGGIPGKDLWHRCNFISGIEYGYSLPVSRRLNIDFSLALGYIGGKQIKYIPKNGQYEWQSTRQFNWFGPTKAEVSLVWLIGCDNYNRTKGGKL